MKLDIQFSQLLTVVRRMGAKPVIWRSTTAIKHLSFRRQLEEGVFEFEDLSEVVPTRSGELTLRGERILLYIRDTQSDPLTLRHHPEKSKRFHIAECSTLETMRQKQRYSRYVATRRTSGFFIVDAREPASGKTTEMEAQLRVCRNCLTVLNYKGYGSRAAAGRDAIWGQFSIAEFFSANETRFLKPPAFDEQNFPGSSYTDGWARISNEAREKADWRCERCSVGLSNHRTLLQVHHRNGVKGDNRLENLQVLCLLCHAEMPDHGRMFVHAADRQLIEDLRTGAGRSHSS